MFENENNLRKSLSLLLPSKRTAYYRLLQSQQSIWDLMVYRAISSQMKQRALELLDQGWEVGDIVVAGQII